VGEARRTSPPGQIAAGTIRDRIRPIRDFRRPFPARSPRVYEPEAAAHAASPCRHRYLVANSERGDVIVWYNCAALKSVACQDLKGQIQTAMDVLGGEHIIAFPWPSLEQPAVLTAWGYILRLPSFDLKRAVGFIYAHRGRGPTR
jgi:hypothetical protein